MKKTIVTLSLLMAGLFAQHEAQAQYVTLPDTNFRNYMRGEFASCFNTAGLLDTTAAAALVVNEFFLDGMAGNLNNISGIQYFKGIKRLDIMSANITELPKLPLSLEALSISYANNLTSIAPLPPTLHYLGLEALENLNTLPSFPFTIQKLYIKNLPANSLGTLPDSLKELDVLETYFGAMPTLPAKLERLNWMNNSPNNEQYINAWPAAIKTITLGYGGYTIAGLTNTVESFTLESVALNCPSFGNNVSYIELKMSSSEALPTLPNSLETLWIEECGMAIPQLPSNLKYFTLLEENMADKCLPVLPEGLLELKIFADDYGSGVMTSSVNCIPNRPVALQIIGQGVMESLPLDLPVCNPANNVNQCQNYATFTGRAFRDLNSNGLYEEGEPLCKNVKLSAGNRATYTNAQGMYWLVADTLGTLSITTSNFPAYYTASQASQSATFANYSDVITKDFALVATQTVKDVAASITNYTPARSGFNLKMYLSYENVGTLSANAVAKFVKPAFYTVNSASVAGYTVSGDTLIWNLGTMAIGETKNIIVYGTVSTAAVFGSVISFQSFMNENDASDNNLADNTKTLNLTVVGSFDPNDKQAREAISPAQIADGEYIDYTIRFQNTGTDTAFTVVIADTLANTLQANTLEVMASSHNVRTNVKGNIVYFEHLNIQLPDSNVNEKASHGFVSFRIKPQANLALGTNISNKAAIYFDYNAPVITNTAVTKV
ncbi:conserved repeat domain-containing protein, partial [Flexibacter flexilis DSM 6793]